MNDKQEERFRNRVIRWVVTLDGRFSKCASDEMLVALLVCMAHRPSRADKTKSIGQKILGKKDVNEAYDIAQWLFEFVIECNCHKTMNGHHVAQDFAGFMTNTGRWERKKPSPAKG